MSQEHGVLLTVVAPILRERAAWYRQVADMLAPELGEESASVLLLRTQAEKADAAILSIARRYDNARR